MARAVTEKVGKMAKVEDLGAVENAAIQMVVEQGGQASVE